MKDVLRECIGKRVKCGEDLGWVIGLARGTYIPIVRFDSGAKDEIPRWALTVIAVQDGE
jgi:hypothetical protein